MKRHYSNLILVLLAVLAMASCAGGGYSEKFSGKEIYIPNEFSEMDFNDTLSRYCFQRMDTTPNIVYFWEKGFGNDFSTAPDLDGENMKFDFEAMKAAAERFYIYYRDTLKFIEPGSKADKYRMMVMIDYSKESTAYGGAYDNTIGAIWVTPSRLREKRFNCIAHELGHAFQAQIAADGLTSAGGPIWEVTSQWMLFHVNPHWMTEENYHWKNYMNNTHIYPFSEKTMYCNAYFAEYWSEKHGLEIMSRIWRNNTDEHDPILLYQIQTGIDQAAFNDEWFDAALRFVTYDLDRIRPYAKPYRNAHTGKLVHVGGNKYEVPVESAPQYYGYNAVKLAVPQPGSEVVLNLEGVMPENATGEWNYALLPVKNDSVPDYAPALRSKTVSGKGKEIRYTVPADGISHLWLVVNSAPGKHEADKTEKTQWKYSVSLSGTKPE